jgi:hypothetical protein
MPRKTAGPVLCFYKGNRPYGLFDILLGLKYLDIFLLRILRYKLIEY